jgi:adenine-specific DNA-methyltransferase
LLRNSVFVTKSPKVTFARSLRKSQTTGEKSLWQRLRARRFEGLKFRRQVPIGPYIVDFLCAEKRIILEIDGDSHFQPGAKEKDEKRELYLCQQNFKVLRFTNQMAVEFVEKILSEIRKVVYISKG